jgi:hypothetical protein
VISTGREPRSLKLKFCLVTLLHSKCRAHITTTSKVENSAQFSSCQLNFVYALSYNLTNVNARFILTEAFDLVSGIGRPLSRLGASSEPCQEGSKASLHRVRPVPHFYSRSVTSLVFKNIFASRAPIYDVTGMDTALCRLYFFCLNWHELEQAQLY